MSEKLLHNAILNNADWCELVANSHGVTSERLKNSWRTAGLMPPFYPNVVSTTAGTELKDIFKLEQGLPSECGWKDSYADLDLAEFGFSKKFDAHWYALLDNNPNLAFTDSVGVVSSSGELGKWITAWGETPINQAIFTPELLTADVQFLFREIAGQLDSGLIVNRSANAVGISNIFGKANGIIECISYAFKNANGLPLVGYGSAEELNNLKTLGFKELGTLRVWLR